MGGSCAHIHIGPGAIGLGLIVASSVEAGLPVHLVARANSKLTCTRFGVEIGGTETEPVRDLPVASLSFADRVDELDAKALVDIDTCDDLLVTVSVTTEHVGEIAELVLGIASRRVARTEGSPTMTFIAAENDPGPAYPPLSGSFRL
jgi:hypothetical protein